MVIYTLLMRINRYISQSGSLSRRAADAAIESGRVTINGRRAVLGDTLDPEVDRVCIDGLAVRTGRKWYLALNKPRFVVTTLSDPEGRPCIRALIPKKYQGVFPAGRLDFDAEGLLILTNDGDMANAIHHPSYGVPKEYIVRLTPVASREALEQMAHGVVLDGRKTRPAEVERIRDDTGGTWVRIVLKQGLKNQIKRMAASVGLTVASLKRVAVGPVRLKDLRPGQIRELSASERKLLDKMLKKPKVT
ncbi:MAG TPA: pseudouridine synthase [Deltaproteobacteria bacterium]|nr:pseudouridine synthase [Deltaproteobacteria bacterium]